MQTNSLAALAICTLGNAAMADTMPAFSGTSVTLQFAQTDQYATLNGATAESTLKSVNVSAGHLFASGDWRFGGELKFRKGSFDSTNSNGGASNGDFDMVLLGAKVGYQMETWMPFATVSFGRASDSTGDNFDVKELSAGVEYAFTGNLFGVVDVHHTEAEFSNPTFVSSGNGLAVGLGWRF